MAVANLLLALKRNGNTLKNVQLFGRIRCMIESPSLFKGLSTAPNGAYAILDTFALKCMKEDYFYDSSNVSTGKIYYTKGSIIIYLSNPNLVGKYCKVGGRTVGIGANIKKQRNSGSPNSGITAFVFSKGDDGSWLVNPNAANELNTKDSDLKSPGMWEFVLKSIAENTEIQEYPVLVDGLMEYEGLGEYTELNPQEVNYEASNKKFVPSTNERIDVTKIDMHLTYHMDAIERPPICDLIEEDIDGMSASRLNCTKDYVNSLNESFEKFGGSEEVQIIAGTICNQFVYNIAEKFAENVGNSKIKGREYVTQVLDCLFVSSLKAGKEQPKGLSEKQLTSLKEKVFEDPSILLNGSEEELGWVSDAVQFAIAIIAVSIGTWFSSLKGNYKSINKVVNVGVDLWFYALVFNPYMLSLLGSSISIVEADSIYFSYGKVYGDLAFKEVQEVRNDILYLQNLEKCCKSDSMIYESRLKAIGSQKSAGYQLDNWYSAQRLLSSNKFPCRADLVELLTVILGVNVRLSKEELSEIVNPTWYSKDRTERLVDQGLVNIVDNGEGDVSDEMLMLEKDYEKEYFIFKKLIEKGRKLTGVEDEDVEKAIETFEENMGFSLEQRQREGIYLTKFKAACLSGCAGSGKTTTSDCMKICLENTIIPNGYKFVYCTPTGKASRRLAEVVGGLVKTIHSEFRIGVGVGESYFTKVGGPGAKGKDKDINGYVYFIDESGMMNRDILYEVVKNLNDSDMVFFLGDIKQLPPIGVGVPFYTLMQILPCVELGVNKRAAEGSEVNYNTTLINHMSDNVIQELMFNNDSFIKVNCDDSNIPKEVLSMWQRFMNGSIDGVKHEEKEIQVISGYTTPTKIHSSTILNPLLQKMLRKGDKLLFMREKTVGGENRDRCYYKNDRVIHVNSNLYGTKRFIEVSKGVYKEVATIGVINGELGILVGCVRSDLIVIEDFVEDELMEAQGIYEGLSEEQIKGMLDNRTTYEEKMINMQDLQNADNYFVIVKVYDVDLKMDVYVFYYGRQRTKDGILFLGGNSLNDLDLSYALTTHKMQGSQTPIAIIPLGSDCSPNFINRNMLNTMITRSQGIVGIIGSVDGADSALNQGRMEVSTYETKCLLSILGRR